MFDFGFNELLLLSILIIIFFGPKELPVVLRAIHNFFSKLWVYSKEIRTSIESLVDDADITNQVLAPGRPQRYEEFYSGTVRYGIFAKSRYTGIFRCGISLIFSYRDFLEIVQYFLVFLYWCN